MFWRLNTLLLLWLYVSSLAVGVLSAHNYSRLDFPPTFIFGSGTSAYQVLHFILFLLPSHLFFPIQLAKTINILRKKNRCDIKLLFYVFCTLLNFLQAKVEGAADKDGRTPSIWDTFAHAGKFIILFTMKYDFCS